MAETPERCPTCLRWSPRDLREWCRDPWHDAPPQPVSCKKCGCEADANDRYHLSVQEMCGSEFHRLKPAPGGFEEALTILYEYVHAPQYFAPDGYFSKGDKALSQARAAHAEEVEQAEKRGYKRGCTDVQDFDEQVTKPEALEEARAAGVEQGRLEQAAKSASMGEDPESAYVERYRLVEELESLRLRRAGGGGEEWVTKAEVSMKSSTLSAAGREARAAGVAEGREQERHEHTCLDPKHPDCVVLLKSALNFLEAHRVAQGRREMARETLVFLTAFWAARIGQKGRMTMQPVYDWLAARAGEEKKR